MTRNARDGVVALSILVMLAACNRSSSSSNGGSTTGASTTKPTPSPSPVTQPQPSPIPVTKPSPAPSPKASPSPSPSPTAPSRAQYAYAAANSSINTYKIDPQTAALTASGAPVSLFAPGTTPPSTQDIPTFAQHPNGKLVYSTVSDLRAITSFSIDATTGVVAPLTQTNLPATTLAGQPIIANVAVHSSGKFLYALEACYLPAFQAVLHAYSVDATTGGLTALTGSPFPFAANQTFALDPLGRFLYSLESPTLGQAVIHTYVIDATTGLLTSGSSTAPASLDVEPNTIAVAAKGDALYVIQPFPAMAIQRFAIDAQGNLTAGATVAFAQQPLSVWTHPSGFVYVETFSGFGAGSLVPVSVSATGQLTAGTPSVNVNAGAYVFSVAFDPTGGFAFVTNFSVSLSVYVVDAATGALTVQGNPLVLSDATTLTLR